MLASAKLYQNVVRLPLASIIDPHNLNIEIQLLNPNHLPFVHSPEMRDRCIQQKLHHVSRLITIYAHYIPSPSTSTDQSPPLLHPLQQTHKKLEASRIRFKHLDWLSPFLFICSF